MSNVTFNPNYQNRAAYPRFGTISVYDKNGNFLYETDGLAGIMTGYQDDRSGSIPWLQLIPVDGIHLFGYVQEDKVELRIAEEIAPYNAQLVIDELIDNDKKTLNNLLVCAGIIEKLAKVPGVNTSAYEAKIRELYIDLYNRNHALDNNYLMEDVKTGSSTLTEYGSPLAKIVNGQSVGIVLTATTVLIIVVSAVVAGGLGTAAYYAYRSSAYRSGKGLKESAALRQALESVSPEVAEEIRKDLNGQLENAYTAGMSSHLLSTVKMLGIAVGAIFLYRYVSAKL